MPINYQNLTPKDQKLTPKEQEILDLITSQNALVSIAFDLQGEYDTGYKIDYSRIDKHYLNSMADPQKHRFSRSLDFFSDPWIPKYDILLISLPENAKLDDELMQNAQKANQPILIQRSNGAFSIYGFDYYGYETDDGLQWKERPLSNLSVDDIELLKRFCFDGRIIKKEDGLPVPNSPNPLTDTQKLYQLVSQFHNYLPLVGNKMDMHTREVYQHVPGGDRFTINKGVEYENGTIISMSMDTPDPRWMELFNCDDGVGFLWNINHCNLHKEKYVFTTNAGTDACYWIDLNSGYDYDWNTDKIRYIAKEEKITNLTKELASGEIPITTIDALRARNLDAVKNKTPIVWNEILAGAPKRKVDACFATQDQRIARLRALRMMQHTKEKLNLPEDLPLYINQPYYAEWNLKENKALNREAVFRFYQVEEQKADLESEKADQEVADAVLAIIKKQNALAVTVSDENMIDKYLNSTGKVDTALLPTDPEWMKLSDDDKPVVGLLWDINTCTLDDEARAMLPELEAKNNNAVNQHQVIDRNTLPVTLPTNQINAMFCYYNEYDLDARVKAIELAAYTKEKLKLSTNIPIILIQKGSKSCQYTDIDQLMDTNSTRYQLRQLPKQKTRHPQKQPPLTRYDEFKEKRKLAAIRFFAPNVEKDEDWENLSKKDCVQNDNEKQPTEENTNKCIVM